MNKRCVLASIVLGIGCGLPLEMEEEGTDEDVDDDIVREIVGPEGGTLAGHGVTLDIPAGALASATELSLRVVDEPPAEGVLAVSPVIRFEPAGTVFAEPVHVTMEVEHDGFSTMYWSVEGDDTAFEAIGVGAAGLAEGWTHHFSLGFTGQGACESTSDEPTITKCACRAGDEIADLLCPVDPTMTDGQCPDILGHMGSDGGGCSGYGARDMLMYQCYCLSGAGDYLCPDAYVFQPSQQCPSEGGLHGYFVEEPMGSCSGDTIVTDPETNESMSQGASGMLVDCDPYADTTEFESLSGTLEGCYTTTEAEDGTCPDDDDGPEQPAVSQDCQTLVADLEKRRVDAGLPRTACLEPPPSRFVGTEIGQHLELELFASDADHLSQVEVPWGSKGECETATNDRSSPGYLDLLEVASRDDATKTITVRFAEIKPMTSSGLAAGREDLECYRDRVADAGARCKDTKDDGSSLEEYVDFCSQLGAIGWTVKLADDWKLRWAPTDPFMHTFEAAPKDTRTVLALLCEDGITAYQCVEP